MRTSEPYERVLGIRIGLRLMDLALGVTPGGHTDRKLQQIYNTYKNKTKGTSFFGKAKISITASLIVTVKETMNKKLILNIYVHGLPTSGMQIYRTCY